MHSLWLSSSTKIRIAEFGVHFFNGTTDKDARQRLRMRVRSSSVNFKVDNGCGPRSLKQHTVPREKRTTSILIRRFNQRQAEQKAETNEPVWGRG
jgi:hypothetical protein